MPRRGFLKYHLCIVRNLHNQHHFFGERLPFFFLVESKTTDHCLHLDLIEWERKYCFLQVNVNFSIELQGDAGEGSVTCYSYFGFSNFTWNLLDGTFCNGLISNKI